MYPLCPIIDGVSSCRIGLPVNQDLALLILEKPVTSVEPITIAENIGNIDSQLKILGFRDQQYRSQASGFIKSIGHDSVELEFNQLNIRAVGGDSGSPVLNENGELVGVLSRTILGQNKALMVNVPRLRHWISVVLDRN